jgi:hypothetical protein
LSENDKLCRKVRKTSKNDIGKATLNWSYKMRAINTCISGPTIQEAAPQFVKEFEAQVFKHK